MQFVRTVGARIANAVGNGSEGAKLGDEVLQDCKQRLDELEQQVTSVRSQFATYAEQMMQSCEASVLLSKSVADFYRAANNSARSESVKVYEQVQDAAANNAVAIYQRQLQMEDGVISELDQWLQIVARVNEQLEEADRLRQAAETAASRLQTLQNKVDSRRQGGSIFGQNNETDIQNRIEETERAQKNFEADFVSARDEVRDNVGRIMQKRFTMFDRVYVQILECQVHFFESAAKDVDGFKRSIRNYRRKFPRDSGSNMSSALSTGLARAASAAASDETPKPRPVLSQRSAPVAAAMQPQPQSQSQPTEELQGVPRHRKKETDFLGGMMDFGEDEPGITNEQASESTGDLVDFGAFVSAPTQSPPQHQGYRIDEPERTADDNMPPRAKRQVSDLFGLNLFGSQPHVHSDTEVDDMHRAQHVAPRRGSKSTLDLETLGQTRPNPAANGGGYFDDDFWSSAPASRAASNHSQPMDMGMDPFGGPDSGSSPKQDAPVYNDENNRPDPPHLMQEVPAPAGGRPGVLVDNDAATRREFVRQLQEDEKRNHDNREQAQDAVEARLREWEYKGDVRRNLRSLLTSMDRVLWDGAKWKPVQMSDLLNPTKISKKYKKALNSVHPDKISLTRGFTPEQIAIAEGVFMALNEAWIEYEKTQQ